MAEASVTLAKTFEAHRYVLPTTSLLRGVKSFDSERKRNPFSGQIHSAGELLHTP